MSIREIARSLYQLKKRVEELERACRAEPPGARRDSLERELLKARAEHERVRRILEGEKEDSSTGRP
ncbi:MAG: hypothetical protein ACLFVT_01565 [Syntrophobacteria bacterium]